MLPVADRQALASSLRGELSFDEPMARHTTLRIGGPADAWFLPADVDDAQAALSLCAARQWPVTAVGGGSNLLVKDGGIRGMVLGTRSLRKIQSRGPLTVFAEAGVATGKLLHYATERHLGGVEFLAGVPGSVGGGLIMNAGTYLGELKDVVAEVISLRPADGQRVVRTAGECGFAYRHSDLPEDELVVAAHLELFPRPRAEIEADVAKLRAHRQEREPKTLPNAGSIFKNPPGDFAGRLLEAAGLKGRRVGGAEISPRHANWIVNVGGATAADVLALVDIAREAVARTAGVTLETEIKIIGEN